MILGIENLDAVSTAKALEMFVALLGIVLLTPIFLPEQNKDIKDLVKAKFISSTVVYIIRILESLLSLIIFIGVAVLILKFNGCTFPEMNYFLGTLAEAIFLGGIGIFTYRIFDQIAVAYMLPMMYYIMAISGGRKLLKDFYLFSMMYGSYREKIVLVTTGLILIMLALTCPYLYKRVFKRN